MQTQLWAAATRLQRSQSKLEHLAQTSRKEIATLLAQELRLRASDVPTEALEAERLLGVARLKGEKLLVDDEAGDLMSLLERYCDILLEAKLPESSFQLDQDCLEAVSGIVATSSRTDSSELHTLSQSLAQKYHDITSEHELKQNISSKYPM
ncbi:hypothetical protein CPB86DRAFT_399961 [Serendipita vermifera]|nr:hypothetical protein CPB86DRAFT_399961 [Serendipita vermifera]